MKMVFVGSHGSGKTSTSQRLANELYYPFVEEGAREVFTEMEIGEDLSQVTIGTAIEIQRRILKNHITKANRHGNFIADRGVIDVYAYSLYWLSREEEAKELLSETKQIALNFSNFYNLVILTPPRIPIIGDGVRATQYYYREHIHHLIQGILEDFGYKYEILHTEHLEDRIEECKGLVQLYNARNRVW